jgi:D-ribose pyranose/furanose isomerase RbsD
MYGLGVLQYMRDFQAIVKVLTNKLHVRSIGIAQKFELHTVNQLESC